MEHVSCDLCGGTNLTEIDRVPDRYPGAHEMFSLVRCSQCSLVFVNPRPAKAEIGKYYGNEYPSFKPARGLFLRIKKYLMKREVREIAQHFNKKEISIFEVGMGSGEDLALLRDYGGFTVAGMDVNPAAVHAAQQQFNLESHSGELEELKMPSDSYDVVRAKYVASHVHSPKLLFREIHRIVKPQGIVMLWIPNFNSWARKLFGSYWEGQDPPRHLFDFTPETIGRYLIETGFELQELTYSMAPNTWLHSTRNVLAKFFKGTTHTGRLHTLGALFFLPFSVAAALFKQSDRIIIIAEKNDFIF